MSTSRVLCAAAALAAIPVEVWGSEPAPDGGPAGEVQEAPAGPALGDGGLQAQPGETSPPGGEEVAGLIARADEAYRRRDEPGRLDEVRRELEAAQKLAPGDYDVLWRLSRYYFWVSDDPSLSDDERSRLGRTGWDLGDRATAANPRGVEGWFYAVGGMGNYSLGIGILRALAQGLESKFKDRLRRAQAIDPRYLDGGIENAWGRFYFKLPWPKYKPDESERHLLRALRVNPENVRGRVYLAELYLKEDQPKEARVQLEKVIAQRLGKYDEPEERRYQERARAILSQLR